MNPAPEFPDPATRADREAADWLIRHDRGLTASEQDEFLHWLAASAEHRERFARHRATWQEFNLLAQWRPEHSAEPNPDLLARPRWLRRRIGPRAVLLALAAAVAVGAILWSQRGHERSRFPDRLVAVAYEQHVLADGSIVDLNAGTRLAVRFTAGERRVELQRGEAQFTVTKNPSRPFVVRAGGVDVRAVGTSFNVKLAAADVEVLVTEGRVQVSPPRAAMSASPDRGAAADRSSPAVAPESPELIAGQRAVVSLAGPSAVPRVLAASAEDVSRLLSWQPQLLDFDSTPLSRVVVEFNRRNRTQLVVADAELNALPIVASFRSDNLDGFVRLLQVSGDVRVERRGAHEIVLRKAR